MRRNVRRPQRKRKTRDQIAWKKRETVRKLRIGMIVVSILLAIALFVGVIILGIYIKNTDNLEWKWLNEFMGITPEVSASSAPKEESEVSSETEETDFRLLVVNKEQPLPEAYVPSLQNFEGIQIESRIEPSLKKMLEDAKESGITITVTQGYVSREEQAVRYEEKVDSFVKRGMTRVTAQAKAAEVCAKSGESEYHTGLLIDVDSSSSPFEESEAYRWLVNHGVEYGFVFRYPSNKVSQTKMAFAPQTLRYVGEEHSIRMRQLQMCLEEYAAYIEAQNS